MTVNYDRLPEHMQAATRRYIEQGAKPGDFLTAVIRHDLFLAVGHADPVNLAALRDWCQFFYNEAPGSCHGSPDRMTAWMARRGLEGVAAPKPSIKPLFDQIAQAGS